MKNPLRKRLPRELKTEFGKYLVIFLLLVATIGLVSGFLVADGSMIIAYNEGFEKYSVENGNFLLEKRANKAQMKAIEAAGGTLYEKFYSIIIQSIIILINLVLNRLNIANPKASNITIPVPSLPVHQFHTF